MLELIGQHRRQSPASRAVGLDTRMSGGVFEASLVIFVKFFVHSTKLLSQNRQSWSSNVFKTIFCTFQVMPVLSSAWCCRPSPELVSHLLGPFIPVQGRGVLAPLCTWYHSNCRDLASPLPLLSRHFVKITVTFWFQFELIMSVIVNISLVWLRILHTITLTIVTA